MPAGSVRTLLPLWVHVMGLPEVVLQALLLSVVLCYWVDHPEKRWVTWLMVAAFVLVIVFPALGLAVGQGQR